MAQSQSVVVPLSSKPSSSNSRRSRRLHINEYSSLLEGGVDFYDLTTDVEELAHGLMEWRTEESRRGASASISDRLRVSMSPALESLFYKQTHPRTTRHGRMALIYTALLVLATTLPLDIWGGTPMLMYATHSLAPMMSLILYGLTWTHLRPLILKWGNSLVFATYAGALVFTRSEDEGGAVTVVTVGATMLAASAALHLFSASFEGAAVAAMGCSGIVAAHAVLSSLRGGSLAGAAANVLLLVAALLGGFLNALFEAWQTRETFVSQVVSHIQEQQMLLNVERMESVLAIVMPSSIAERLKTSGSKEHGRVTVFDDIADLVFIGIELVDFESSTVKWAGHLLMEFYSELYTVLDDLAAQYGAMRVRTDGPALLFCMGTIIHEHPPMAVEGKDLALSACELGLEMTTAVRNAVREFVANHTSLPRTFFAETSTAIHRGGCAAGLVGLDKFRWDAWGITVDHALLMRGAAPAGSILVSAPVQEVAVAQYRLEAFQSPQLEDAELRTWLLLSKKQKRTSIVPSLDLSVISSGRNRRVNTASRLPEVFGAEQILDPALFSSKGSIGGVDGSPSPRKNDRRTTRRRSLSMTGGRRGSYVTDEGDFSVREFSLKEADLALNSERKDEKPEAPPQGMSQQTSDSFASVGASINVPDDFSITLNTINYPLPEAESLNSAALHFDVGNYEGHRIFSPIDNPWQIRWQSLHAEVADELGVTVFGTGDASVAASLSFQRTFCGRLYSFQEAEVERDYRTRRRQRLGLHFRLLFGTITLVLLLLTCLDALVLVDAVVRADLYPDVTATQMAGNFRKVELPLFLTRAVLVLLAVSFGLFLFIKPSLCERHCVPLAAFMFCVVVLSETASALSTAPSYFIFFSRMPLLILLVSGLPGLELPVHVAASFVSSVAFVAVSYALDTAGNLFLMMAFVTLLAWTVPCIFLVVVDLSIRVSFVEERVVETRSVRSESLEDVLDALVVRIVPKHVARRLFTVNLEDHSVDSFPNLPILVCEIVGFSELVAGLTALEAGTILNRFVTMCEAVAFVYGMEKIKSSGGMVICCSELRPLSQMQTDLYELTTQVVEAALALLDMFAHSSKRRKAQQSAGESDSSSDDASFEVKAVSKPSIRVAIHRGPVTGGVLGEKNLSYELVGDVVRVTTEMARMCGRNRLLVSAPIRASLRRNNSFTFQENKLISSGRGTQLLTYYLGRHSEGGLRSTNSEVITPVYTSSPAENQASAIAASHHRGWTSTSRMTSGSPVEGETTSDGGMGDHTHGSDAQLNGPPPRAVAFMRNAGGSQRMVRDHPGAVAATGRRRLSESAPAQPNPALFSARSAEEAPETPEEEEEELWQSASSAVLRQKDGRQGRPAHVARPLSDPSLLFMNATNLADDGMRDDDDSSMGPPGLVPEFVVEESSLTNGSVGGVYSPPAGGQGQRWSSPRAPPPPPALAGTGNNSGTAGPTTPHATPMDTPNDSPFHSPRYDSRGW